MNNVLDLLKEEFKCGDTVVIACSGGPDSMALLNLVNTLKQAKQLKIIVAHVNHKVRLESDAEELFLKKYALEHDLIFEVTHFNEYQNNSFHENEAREKRYTYLENIVLKYQAQYLLTAHHGDDLIETILMRITRGSNLKGYLGIKEKTYQKNYIILRPLLRLSKEEILDYNKENNIPYVKDSSNTLNKYTRNRYRKNILPFLKKEEKNITEKYYQFSKELESYNEFVNEYIKNKNFIVDNYILINKLKEETLFIQRKTIELLIRLIQNVDILDVNKKQIDMILKIMNDTHNKSCNLQNDYIVRRAYDKLYLEKNTSKQTKFKYVLENNLYTDKWSIIYSKELDKSNYTIALDSNEVSLPLMVRSREEGDFMTVKNLKGHKKISDIMIDEKISKALRESYPIVVDSKNEIVWLPGLKKSQFSKDKSQKYDIILKYEVRN